MSSISVLEPETKSSQLEACDTRYQSWGRFPRVAHRSIRKVSSADELPQLLQNTEPGSLLPYGMGRSYGDSCLNTDKDLLDCTSLNRILKADWTTGRIRVEAGMSFADLLKVIVPHGWFLPVTPGTKFVTVGGAIANDVHGKNHHRAGTFGCHVEQLMLYRSDGTFVCSLSRNRDLFRATVGGLGLTGVIGWADIRLKRIAGDAIQTEALAFRGLDEFLRFSVESDQQFEYTVAWIDCLSGKQPRGISFRGNHADLNLRHGDRKFTIPFPLPEFVLNRTAVRGFNAAYYRRHARKAELSTVHYDKFFYPLDSVHKWNLIYGKRGLVQYQCVVPRDRVEELKQIIEMVSDSGYGSFLAVLKVFGEVMSPGMLSFPRPGLTLAVDLPVRGARTLSLLERLDEIVLASGGALYPAKDARMNHEMFTASFCQWKQFVRYIDPKLSSTFWRRVTGG